MDARDIMTTDVVTLTADMTVAEAAELLVRYRIHGAPVVDTEGQLIGMVSVMDLAGRVGGDVRSIMTRDTVTAGEDTPVEELAGMMLDQMVRRIPIVQGGRVIGIVSARDIPGLPEPARNHPWDTPRGGAAGDGERATAYRRSEDGEVTAMLDQVVRRIFQERAKDIERRWLIRQAERRSEEQRVKREVSSRRHRPARSGGGISRSRGRR